MKKLTSLCLAAAALALAGCTSMPMADTSALPQPMPPGQVTAGKTEVLWLGQASVRITTPGGKVIMIDPWLTSNPKTPANFKQLSALGKVDAVLVTHAHFDHFADAPAIATMHKAPMYGPAGLGQSVSVLGILPNELAPRFGKSGTVAPWGPTGPKISQVRAEHSSELQWKDAAGKDQMYPGGEPVGFIIEMENGFKVWHMGDTGVFGDMRLIGEMYKPDLVLIPIGGHFVMDPRQAAMAVTTMIKPRFAIPIHFGTLPVLRGTPAEFGAALGSGPGRMIELQPGQKVDF